MEYYLVMRKTKIPLLTTIGMDLESIMLSEVSGRERQMLYNITYMWNWKVLFIFILFLAILLQFL